LTSPRWSIVEVQPREWWAADMTSGTACFLRENIGERLWRSHALLDRSLNETLSAAENLGDSTFLDLEFIGVTTRYVYEDAEVGELLATLYAAAIPPLRRSPDVIVRIRADADLERLHRSVSTDRVGVDLRAVASQDWEPGSAELPVIPPMQSAPFAGRYCALHSALLSTPRGGVLICGNQRAGKTSAALLAQRLGFATVLTDEMVLIDQRGEAYGVPLPIRERTSEGRQPWALKARESWRVAATSVVATVLLEPIDGVASWTRVAGVQERLRRLSVHIRALDGPLGRATANVLAMLRTTDVWLWQVGPWPRLMDDLERGFGVIRDEY